MNGEHYETFVHIQESWLLSHVLSLVLEFSFFLTWTSVVNSTIFYGG